jgi:hypothetical protein
MPRRLGIGIADQTFPKISTTKLGQPVGTPGGLLADLERDNVRLVCTQEYLSASLTGRHRLRPRNAAFSRALKQGASSQNYNTLDALLVLTFFAQQIGMHVDAMRVMIDLRRAELNELNQGMTE